MHKQAYPTKKVYPPARKVYGGVAVRGFNLEEYETIRAAVAQEIPFPVRLTVNEQRYVFGTLNLLPTKEDMCNGNRFTWTPEQYETVYQFMSRHGLTVSQPDLLQPDKSYVWGSGVWYIYRAA